MGYLRKITSILRKAILIGWAVAVVWIYLGNLVNFHMNHIWGKQLIPVEWSTTHGKQKKSVQLVKNDRNSKAIDSGLHFDFTAPHPQVLEISYFEINLSVLIPTDAPLLHQGIQAFSLRGPPTA